MKKLYWIPVVTLALGASVAACEDKPNPDAAPVSSALAPAKPKTAASLTFAIEADSSKVNFTMEAPVEKIHGDAPKSVEGDIFVDLMDVTKSTGLLKVDLEKLVIAQQVREDDKSEFPEKKVNPTQNEHMKTWLQIDDKASEEDRKKNRYVEFKIKKVASKGGKNINEMKGAERKVTLTLTGDLRVHQRTLEQTTDIEIVFKYDGDKPVSMSVKSLKPMKVNLDKHDIRPRDTFGKIAKKTLGDMLNKVASDAPVSIEFNAKAKGDAKPAAGGGAKPASSAGY